MSRFIPLKKSTLIEICRVEKSFAANSKINYEKKTIDDAIKSDDFNTCRGTMIIYARDLDGNNLVKRGYSVGFLSYNN